MRHELEHEDEPEQQSARSRRPRGLLAGFVLIPVLAFTLLLASGLGRDPRELPSELVGRRAPTFTLPRLGGGGQVDLASLRGQVVVVNFWASWCLACREEHPDLLTAWERYRERGLVLVGVDYEGHRGGGARVRGGDGRGLAARHRSGFAGGDRLRRVRRPRDVGDRAGRLDHGQEGRRGDL